MKRLTNKQKQEWLKAHSERLVQKTFKNLEDNFNTISKDYEAVYLELIANVSKAVEETLVDNSISSPMLLQNKLMMLVQQAVTRLTLLDKQHDTYLQKMLKDYHTTITAYQIDLIKKAREEGILFSKVELNETALQMAIQFPYQEYSFVTGLNNGTFKVHDKLNKLLANKILDGTSVVKLSKEIEATFNIKKHVAERIARTETSRILNQASLNTYKQAGLTKVKWLDSTEAIKSSRRNKTLVCKDCRKVATHNGGIYPIDEVPSLPLHPYCRCTVTPVVE